MAIESITLLGEATTAGPEAGVGTSDPVNVTLDRPPTSGSLVYVVVSISAQAGNPSPPTVSGAGVSWVRDVDRDIIYGVTSQGGWWLFRGVAGSSPSASILVEPTSQWAAGAINVIEIAGAATSDGGAHAVVQHQGAATDGSVPNIAEMAALSDPGNAFLVLGAWQHASSAETRHYQVSPEVSVLVDKTHAIQPGGRSSATHAHYLLHDTRPNPQVGFQLSGAVNNVILIALELAAADGDPPDPTTVAIDQTDPQQVEVGSTLQLSATVTNGDGATTWASDDEAVATVDASGLVSGVAVGSAEITATNNGVSDSITVNVEAAPAQAPTVTITSPAGNIAVTEGTTIVATATATDPVDGDLSAEIEWTSSVDGALGTGASIQIVTEGWTEGNRTITATATNAAELDGSASFVLTIGEAPEPPEPETRFDAARFAINAAGGIA